MYGITYSELGKTPSSTAWRMIRSLRHQPPGSATRGERARVFDAALEQSEQLIKAAAAVGPQSSPLLLFYGLSQAGRAISAAATSVSNKEYKLARHGISTRNLSNMKNSTLADLIVAPQAGAFSQMATLLNSSDFSESVRIGDLWNLLPGHSRFPLVGQATTVPLNAEVRMVPGNRLSLEISKLPASLAFSIPAGAVAGQSHEADWKAERERVKNYLSSYPSLAGFEFVNEDGPAQLRLLDTEGRVGVTVCFPISTSEPETAILKKRTTVYRAQRLVFPQVGSSPLPAHPILIWWAILYSPSMLARYEPDAWFKCLQVNQSADAVPIEALLDDAAEALPETIHRTIMEVI
jgi:hypothetical protein